ncbi:MAG: ABC transporter ATP-binding protein [Actinomycetota bacterium]|nr:ABC transporter ATP-binding protein [Actinomycetota bacterium]
MTGPVLVLDDVRARYGRIEVLHGLSLAVPRGSVVAVLGPNGAGKTTALRTIAGALPISAGDIRLEGRSIAGRRPSAIARRGLVLVPEGRGVFPSLTVEENLRVSHRSAPAVVAGAWDEWFDDVGGIFPRLVERRAQRAGSLSGGEQQMLALARALVGQPKVVLLDELSMGLAPLVVDQLFDQIAALRAAGRTIVLVEQYLTHALRHADECFVLAKGTAVWHGSPDELRRSGVAAEFLGA